MPVVEITVEEDADAMLQAAPNNAKNYGASDPIFIGKAGAGNELRSLLRFKMPIFTGAIKSQKLKLNVQTTPSAGGNEYYIVEVYVVDAPQDDIWVEGVQNGAIDNFGCSWDDYYAGKAWDTAGGDFGDDPIGIYEVTSPIFSPIDIEIEILKDNFTFDSGKAHSFILKVADFAGHPGAGRFLHLNGGGEVIIELVKDEPVEAPTVTAEPVDSTEIEIGWDEPALTEGEFEKYELWESDSGAFGGEESKIFESDDIDDRSYNHDGLVVQGDVDDYDPASDTYINGRLKYYQLRTFTYAYGTKTSATASTRTIPAMRPVKFIFTPRSKFYDQDYADPNQVLPPYGVQIGFEWTDPALVTELKYIGQTYYDAYFKPTGAGWGSSDETDTVDFGGDMDDAANVEGDIGYVPYKIKGKVFDTGGLYRKATTDKSTEQFEMTWPAPCPVAVPLGALRTGITPDLKGAPFDGGEVVIDLSGSAQQSGDDIEHEQFVGTPTDKWRPGSATCGSFTFVYGTNLLRAFASCDYPYVNASLLTKDYDATPANYNPDAIISKYTGGYHLRKTMKVGFPSPYSSVDKVAFTVCSLANLGRPLTGVAKGYRVLLESDGIEITRRNNFDSTPVGEVLLSALLGSNSPLWPGDTPLAKFLFFDVWVSPIFDKTGTVVGDRLLVVYQKDAVQATAETINWDTLSTVWVIDSTTRPTTEQINYTGTYDFEGGSASAAHYVDLYLYRFEIDGRPLLSLSGDGSGYGVKNITTGEELDLKSTTPRSFPVFCEPDQLSQTIYVEGRLKNQYGAQAPNNSWSGVKGQAEYQGGVINNLDPIAFLSVPRVGYKASDVTLDGSQSIDPEGGALIYKWDFGDGSPILETSESVIIYQYSATGTYTVKLKVEDVAAQESVEVQADIRIYDPIEQFQEVSLMSPWESINQGSPSGSSKTEHPELDYDTVQNAEGGNRIFNLKGIHHDPDCDIALPTRITNAEEERDYFAFLCNQGQLITLDLVNFGKIKGVIIDHKPSMDYNDQQAFEFSMTFQEVDVRQFE